MEKLVQILNEIQIPFAYHHFAEGESPEFSGDQKHIRHVLYNCAASRPGIEGKTNEESREVQTETLKIKATPLSSGLVKAKTGNTTDATVYSDWYKAVYMPTEDEVVVVP